MYVANVLDIIPEWKLGWIAGYLDGEAYIGVVKSGDYAQPKITVSSIVFASVEALVSVTQMGSLSDGSVRSSEHRPARVWTVYKTSDIFMLLIKLQPYILVKRKQADLVIEYCAGKLGNSQLHDIDWYCDKTKEANAQIEVI